MQPRPSIYLMYVKYKKNPKNAGLLASINIYIYIFAGQGDGRKKAVKCDENYSKGAFIDAKIFGLSSILYIFFASTVLIL